MEYNCTCEAGYRGEVYHCPLHSAAEDMYEALGKVREDINWMLNNERFLNPAVFDYLDKALSLVEGK